MIYRLLQWLYGDAPFSTRKYVPWPVALYHKCYWWWHVDFHNAWAGPLLDRIEKYCHEHCHCSEREISIYECVTTYTLGAGFSLKVHTHEMYGAVIRTFMWRSHPLIEHDF